MERTKKRAAIISGFDPSSYKGGVEAFILNLKTLLTDYDISVDVHFLSPAPTLTVKHFPVKSLSAVIPEFLLNCFMMGRAFTKIEKDYDLVISNNYYGLGYYSPEVRSFNIYHSTHAGYANALKDRISDSDYRTLKYLYGYIGDGLSGKGKNRIAVSQTVRDELHRYYKFRKIVVINHGIDTTFYKKINETTPLRRKWDIPADAFVGIFVGRWEIGKGTDIMENMIRSRPDIIWILAIGPSECPLKGFNNVRIMRDVDNEPLRELYSISDFMLLPSYYEGFGLTILEAMACELPVICSEVGVVRDLLRFDALRRLILPNCGKTKMIEEISHRISFIKSANKEEMAAFERSIIETYYPLDVWKSKMAAALGLPL
jgi:glycosyltransferase involved in cell wall biosynthesis